MKTLLDQEIPENIKGVLYLCNFNRSQLGLKVIKTLMFEEPEHALNAFAEIPNPESQIVLGRTHKEMCSELKQLHRNMKNKKWLNELAEQI